MFVPVVASLKSQDSMCSRWGLYIGKGKYEPPFAEVDQLQEYISTPLTHSLDEFEVTVVWNDCQDWGLYCHHWPKMNPVRVHFLEPHHAAYTWKQYQKKSGIFARAIKTEPSQWVIDATAGWGKDTWQLLALGCQVTALEKHPLLAALLQRALKKLLPLNETLSRLNVVNADAFNFLQFRASNDSVQLKPGTIYLDPMFPVNPKSRALNGIEMRVLQQLIGNSGENDHQSLLDRQLLIQSLKSTAGRVVVKRPYFSKELLKGARHTYYGRSIRYDVYFPQDHLDLISDRDL